MRQMVHGRGHNKPDYRKIEQGTGFSGKPSSTLLSINRVRAVTGLYASFSRHGIRCANSYWDFDRTISITMANNLTKFARDACRETVFDYVNDVLSIDVAGEIVLPQNLKRTPTILALHLSKHSYAAELKMSRIRSTDNHASGLAEFFELYDTLVSNSGPLNYETLLGLVVTCRTIVHPKLLIRIHPIERLWKISSGFLPGYGSYTSISILKPPVEQNASLLERWDGVVYSLNKDYLDTH